MSQTPQTERKTMKRPIILGISIGVIIIIIIALILLMCFLFPSKSTQSTQTQISQVKESTPSSLPKKNRNFLQEVNLEKVKLFFDGVVAIGSPADAAAQGWADAQRTREEAMQDAVGKGFLVDELAKEKENRKRNEQELEKLREENKKLQEMLINIRAKISEKEAEKERVQNELIKKRSINKFGTARYRGISPQELPKLIGDLEKKCMQLEIEIETLKEKEKRINEELNKSKRK